MITFWPGFSVKLHSYTSSNVPCYWVEANISSVNCWNGVLDNLITVNISCSDLWNSDNNDDHKLGKLALIDGAELNAMVKHFIPPHFFPMLFDHWTILDCILSSNTYFLLDFLALLQQTLDTVDQDQSEQWNNQETIYYNPICFFNYFIS